MRVGRFQERRARGEIEIQCVEHQLCTIQLIKINELREVEGSYKKKPYNGFGIYFMGKDN